MLIQSVSPLSLNLPQPKCDAGPGDPIVNLPQTKCNVNLMCVSIVLLCDVDPVCIPKELLSTYVLHPVSNNSSSLPYSLCKGS